MVLLSCREMIFLSSNLQWMSNTWNRSIQEYLRVWELQWGTWICNNYLPLYEYNRGPDIE